MLPCGNCKIKCISIGFAGKIPPIHLLTKTKSSFTNLTNVNDLPFVEKSENPPPESDKHFGGSEKREARIAQQRDTTTGAWRRGPDPHGTHSPGEPSEKGHPRLTRPTVPLLGKGTLLGGGL